MTPVGLTRELIAMRMAKELRDGMAVNLGIGLPTLVANFLPAGETVYLHAEIAFKTVRADGRAIEIFFVDILLP